MFEKAARLKLRFDSPQGELSVEDLFDIPLASRSGRANLDDIAKYYYRMLRAKDEVKSFVDPDKSIDNSLQLKFDIVKHIIDVRMAEGLAAVQAKSNADKKQKLLALVERKESAELENLPLAELKAMINTL